jgi:hypothetical protein
MSTLRRARYPCEDRATAALAASARKLAKGGFLTAFLSQTRPSFWKLGTLAAIAP